MRHIEKIFIILFIGIQTIAAPYSHFVKEIIHNISHPLTYIKNINEQKSNNDYWFAYEIPTHNKILANCCWNQEKKPGQEFQSCDLTQEINGFGGNNESLQSDKTNIFIHVENQMVSQIVPVSEQCQIKSKGLHITWLADIDELESIEFLHQLATEQNSNMHNNANYALSMHQSQKASQALFDIALLNKKHVSNDAIFWLAEAREDGLERLEKLYDKLDDGQLKQHINFALTIVDNQQANTMLKNIALHDDNSKQSQNALFWLTEKSPNETKEIVLNKLNKNDSDLDIEHAVFTLSRLPNGEGDKSLFQLLAGHYTKEIKKKALFWLSQSENSQTIDRLQEML